MKEQEDYENEIKTRQRVLALRSKKEFQLDSNSFFLKKTNHRLLVGHMTLPFRVFSWQLKVFALFYDCIIYDTNAFLLHTCPVDSREPWTRLCDKKTSNELVQLSELGNIRFLNTREFSEGFRELVPKELSLKESELGKLKLEIQFSDPRLVATMDKIDADVRASWITSSELLTEKGFQTVLAKKLIRIRNEELNRKTFQELVKSEIPNIDALDIKSIVKIRKRHNIDKLWKRVEEARTNNKEDFSRAVSEINSELWDLALKYLPTDTNRENEKIAVKSVISNIPILGTAVSIASDIKEIISNYHFSEHWGSVVLDLKKEAGKQKPNKKKGL